MQIHFPANGNLNPASMACLIKLADPFAVSIRREISENGIKGVFDTRRDLGNSRRAQILNACMNEMRQLWEEAGCMAGPLQNKESVANYLLYMENPAKPDSRSEWGNVCWAFPDEVIAKVMGVSRQAAQQQRKKHESGPESGNFETMNRMMLEDIAASLNIPPLRVLDMESMGASRLLDALEPLPNIPAEKFDIMLQSRQKQWGIGNFGSIWFAAAKKGISMAEAVQLLLVSTPEVDHNRQWELETGIPAGVIKNIRQIPPDAVDAKLADLPDRGANAGSDAVYRVSRRKGVSLPQAVRLLYFAFKPDYCFCEK